MSMTRRWAVVPYVDGEWMVVDEVGESVARGFETYASALAYMADYDPAKERCPIKFTDEDPFSRRAT